MINIMIDYQKNIWKIFIIRLQYSCLYKCYANSHFSVNNIQLIYHNIARNKIWNIEA